MPNPRPIPTTAPPDVYRRRRARVAAALQRPLVIFAGHAPARNYVANTYPFRPGSTYLYFGGPPLENAVLLIEPGSDGESGCTLLRPPSGPDDALWLGPSPSDEDLAAAAGLRPAALGDLVQLRWLLAGHDGAAIAPPFPDTLAGLSELGLPLANPDELRAIVDLRLIKDEHELRAMRRAAEIAVHAHHAALAAARPGRREADAAAAFVSALVAHEAQPSFTPVVTVRGEVLHGQGHTNTLQDGALLLIDAGAEEPGGYASDITRTVPVNGRWSPVQRHLYDVTHTALQTAMAACLPGRRYREVHDLAAQVICEGLLAAELLRGNAAQLVERRAHMLFFPHGVGHLIGLDVHDMEDFGDVAGYPPGRVRRTQFGDKFLRLDRDLQPGMTVTIEPGIYLVPAIWERADLVDPLRELVNWPNVQALLRDNFGGIRIEHTICVRPAGPGGPEVLTDALPTAADEIAACVGTA